MDCGTPSIHAQVSASCVLDVMITELLKQDTLPPVILLFGEEDLLVDEAASALFNAASKSDAAGMSTDVLDGDGQTLDAILSVARSYPMMSDRRTIWVRRFEKVKTSKAKGAPLLDAYLADPMASTTLIFSASIPTAAGIGALRTKNPTSAQRKIKALTFPFSTLLQQSTWIEYPAMKAAQVTSWVQKRCEALGLSVSMPLCEYIITRHGTALRELDLELVKLKTFVGEKLEVDEADVLAVVGDSRSHSIFELQRAIGQANPSLAIAIADRMLSTDRQELMIIAMLTRYFTTLYKLIDAASLNNRDAIASAIGVAPFLIDEYLTALQHLGARRVERALRELRRAESLLKSSPLDARAIVEMLLLAILTSPADSHKSISLDIFAV